MTATPIKIHGAEFKGRFILNTELDDLPQIPVQGELSFVRDSLYIYTINSALEAEWKNLTVELDGSGQADTAARSDHDHDSAYASIVHSHKDASSGGLIDYSDIKNAPVYSPTTYSTSKYDSAQLVVLKDVRPSGVHGGTAVAGALRTRIINTIENPSNHPWVILANNRIVLQPGHYEIDGRVQGFHLNGSFVYFQSVYGDSVILTGSQEYADCDVTFNNIIVGTFSIYQETAFEIKQHCTVSRSIDGFGRALSIPGVKETYSIIRIWRLR